MRQMVIVLVTLAIAGCATPPKQTTDIPVRVARISFAGANNDLLPGVRTPQIATDINETRGDITVTTFPPTYAIACNTDKTECRHAVVGTTLKARYTLEPTGKLRISGMLNSQMGRSVSFMGPIFREIMSVSDSVPIIAARSEEDVIDTYLDQGETLTLRGLAGVEVTISRR